MRLAAVSSLSVLVVLSLVACGPAPQEEAADTSPTEIPQAALERARQGDQWIERGLPAPAKPD